MDIREQALLKKIVENAPDYVDRTEEIKERKASQLALEDIRKYEEYEKANAQLKIDNYFQYVENCKSVCSYLYTEFNWIFNYMVKENVNYETMAKCLYVLKLIEDGQLSQQEGSAIIGKMFAEIYYHKSIKEGESGLSTDNNVDSNVDAPLEMSWKTYKDNQTQQSAKVIEQQPVKVSRQQRRLNERQSAKLEKKNENKK